AEIEPDDIAEPADVLDGYVAIEAELFADGFFCFGVCGAKFAHNDIEDVAGDSPHDDKDDEGDAEERRDHQEQAAKQVALHANWPLRTILGGGPGSTRPTP